MLLRWGYKEAESEGLGFSRWRNHVTEATTKTLNETTPNEMSRVGRGLKKLHVDGGGRASSRTQGWGGERSE